MRFNANVHLLALLVCLAAASGVPALSNTTESNIDPTICGTIINKHLGVYRAKDVYNCLKSVPFHQPVASELLRYINDTIQFQSTLAYLASPPPGYQQPAVDLLGGLAQIKQDVDNKTFSNEYDFELALYRLLSAAHDDHLIMNGGILSSFYYGAPFDIVSLSLDGKELPKLYMADDYFPADAGDYLSQTPSAIATINGQDAIEYLTHFASNNSVGKVEQHADWNMLMRSGALDYQQQLEVFFGQATIYPGDEITVVLENGTRRGPCSWEATYVGPPSTGPLQTPGDFYNFFVLGLYPASFDESQPVVPSPSPTSVTSSPSETTAAESDSGSNGAYPTPETLLPLNDDDIDLPQTFFLNESSIAVLSITQFSAYPAQPNKFVQIIQAFIKRSKDAGMKKVVIDVQQNMGGSPYLAIEVFKQFFPSKEPFTGSRRRAHPVAEALGNVITPYWQELKANNSNYDKPDYDCLLTNEWMVADRLNPDTGKEYNTWGEYFESPAAYGGDNYTKVERYNLRNQAFTREASGITIENLNGTCTQPYSAQDIIILSDGICSSACALFMEMMHHEAQVWTVAVGGRPDRSPMQAPGGSRGAAVYNVYNMDIDISGARSIEPSNGKLAVDRAHGFSIDSASVNLRDQIRRNDSSKTPLQFRFEPADCRVFFTPRTWYNYGNLWRYVAKAVWEDSSFCVSGLAAKPIPPSPTQPFSEPCATATNFDSQYQSNGNESSEYSIYNDDPFNDILDGVKDPTSFKPCDSDRSCFSKNLVCRPISVCDDGKAAYENRCVSRCSLGPFPKNCDHGQGKCQEEGWSKTSRGARSSYGYCSPGHLDCLDPKTSIFRWRVSKGREFRI